MHCTVLTSSYPRTAQDDTSVFIQRICQSLAPKLEKLSLVVPYDRNEAVAETRGGVEIRRFKYGIFTRGRLAFGASLLSNIQKNPLVLLQVPAFVVQMLRCAAALCPRPDVVIAFWILAGIPAFLFKLFTGRPYLLALMGSDALIFKSRVLRWLARPLLHGAAKIVVVSRGLRDLVCASSGMPAAKIAVIQNGVEVPPLSDEEAAELARRQGFSPSGRYLLCVSSLRPMKRIEVLIRMTALLPDYHLILCGKTDLGEYVTTLRGLAQELGCAERVHFMGSVPPHEVFLYMRLATFYVTASQWEGQPNAVLEAMASGLPVCASDIEAHRELIQDGANGMLFDVDKLQEAASRIEECARTPCRRQALVEGGLRSVRALSWERCAAAYVELLGLHTGLT